MKSSDTEIRVGEGTLESGAGQAPHPDLKDPSVVLSLLEVDQVVAAKQRMHFGRRKLSVGVRSMLWGLRVYVVAMLVIVVISAIQAIAAAP